MIKFPKIKTIAKGTAGLSAAGVLAVAYIQPFEGRVHMAYMDVGGVLTVCDGHTGPDIIPDKIYTGPECDHLLAVDVFKAEQAVDKSIKIDMPDKTKAAIISFTYNVGPVALEKSTLVRLANAGDLHGACNQLSRWVFVKGRIVNGLVNRRISEKALCLEGLNSNPWYGV